MKGLESVLSRNGVIYAVLASPEGVITYEFGDSALLPYSGLLDQDFGGSERVVALLRSLEGQFLPQVASQGNLVCMQTLLPSGGVVGAFALESGDAVATQLWAEQLESELFAAVLEDKRS